MSNTATTPKEKQEQFHKKLRSLLSNYDAELSIADFGKAYSANYQIVVDFKWDGSYIEDHGTGEIPQLVLGSFECGDV